MWRQQNNRGFCCFISAGWRHEKRENGHRFLAKQIPSLAPRTTTSSTTTTLSWKSTETEEIWTLWFRSHCIKTTWTVSMSTAGKWGLDHLRLAGIALDEFALQRILWCPAPAENVQCDDGDGTAMHHRSVVNASTTRDDQFQFQKFGLIILLYIHTCRHVYTYVCMSRLS